MLLFEISVSLLKSGRQALGAVYAPVIQTARWATAQRARESERSDRLFFDPLAKALAGEEGRSPAIRKGTTLDTKTQPTTFPSALGSSTELPSKKPRTAFAKSCSRGRHVKTWFTAVSERSVWLIEGLLYCLNVTDVVGQSVPTAPWMQPALKAD